MDNPHLHHTSLANALQARLQALDCPYINTDLSHTLALVGNVSEDRTRLIHWLLTLADNRVLKHAAIYFPPTQREGAFMQTLHACATLGVCEVTDSALVEGKAAVDQQAQFFIKLCDFVELATTKRPTLASQMEQSQKVLSQTIDAAAAQTMTEMFPSSYALFPADILSPSELTHVSSEPLTASTLQDELQREALAITDVQQRLAEQPSSFEASSTEDYTEAKVVTAQLHQQLLHYERKVTAFLSTFEHEIKPWTSNRAASRLSSAGPIAQAVHLKLTNLLVLFQTLKTMNQAYKHIYEHTSVTINQVQKQLALPLQLDEIQRRVQILQETVGQVEK